MTARKQLSCALFFAFACTTLHAQHRIDPPEYQQPEHNDIVLGGNNLHQTVSCHGGNAVYVQGQANHVNVQGTCRFVRVQGNRNHVFVQGNGPIHVEGNDNLIEITDFNTPFSERGEHNRVERRVR